MRLFVTGASGWIGSAAVAELLGAGHHVLGLARTDAAAEAISAAGADVLRGDIGDPGGLAVLQEAAQEHDGVVHLAFRHDIAFSGGMPAALASDHVAIEAFGEALAGTGKPLIIANGLAGLSNGGVITEQDAIGDVAAGSRAANERAALALAQRGVRAASIRFAPTVHGVGEYGFMAVLARAHRAAGAAGYIGDGRNRWPAVHRHDAARLVRLAVEHAPAGAVLHAVGEEGVTLREITEMMGNQLGLPAESISPEEAQRRFGFLAAFLAVDMPASSAVTRELLGWRPTGPTLLEDLAQPFYYGASAA
ncbi:MAG: SDR family oxidoreductase [Thermomicrobiales bacterium]